MMVTTALLFRISFARRIAGLTAPIVVTSGSVTKVTLIIDPRRIRYSSRNEVICLFLAYGILHARSERIERK
jgi:hypothetical protein